MLKTHQDCSLAPNSWTVGEYSDALEDMGAPEHVEASGNIPGGIPEAFHSDLFTDMYQFNAKPSEDLTGNGETVRDLMEVCKELPSYNSLRRRCTMDPFLSYIGAGTLSQEPLAALDRIAENQPDEEGTEGGVSLSDEGDRSDLRRTVRRSVEAANDEIEFMEKVSGNGWGTEASNWERVPMSERLEFYKRLRQGEIRKVLEEAGRWERLLRAQKKSREASIAVTDIEIGGDLSRLLPSELVQLKHRLLRKVFVRNLFEKRCLQYSLNDNVPKGRGPVIVLVDQSSSMRGERDIQSKGLVIGIDTLLKKENRDITAIPFTTDAAHKDRWYRGGRVDTFIEGFEGGGTDLVKSLRRALIEGLSQPDADILLVTDAEYGFPAEELEALKRSFSAERAPHLTSIVIGSWYADQLSELGEVVRVSDLTKSTSREAIASEMNRMLTPLGTPSK